jgi:hypothetical protein
MFGKRLLKGGGSSEVGATNLKAKPKSPRDALAEKIAQLAPGQTMAFRLPPMYGPEIIVVDANKDYPGKGRKYAVATAEPVDGKPGRIIGHIWDSDNPKPVAAWIVLRSGEQIV